MKAREVMASRDACFGERRQDARVAMPLIDRRIGRQTIEVAPAVDVPEPDAEATGEYDIERLVIARAVFALKGVIAVARRQRRISQHRIGGHVHFGPLCILPSNDGQLLFGGEPQRVGFDAAAVET